MQKHSMSVQMRMTSITASDEDKFAASITA